MIESIFVRQVETLYDRNVSLNINHEKFEIVIPCALSPFLSFHLIPSTMRSDGYSLSGGFLLSFSLIFYFDSWKIFSSLFLPLSLSLNKWLVVEGGKEISRFRQFCWFNAFSMVLKVYKLIFFFLLHRYLILIIVEKELYYQVDFSYRGRRKEIEERSILDGDN